MNQTLLTEKLNSLEDGSYVKFMVFQKALTSFSGHSMLIKKTGSSFSFFDPNDGEYLHLTSSELIEKINKAMIDHQGTNMCFMDGEKIANNLSLKHEDKLDPSSSSSPAL